MKASAPPLMGHDWPDSDRLQYAAWAALEAIDWLIEDPDNPPIAALSAALVLIVTVATASADALELERDRLTRPRGRPTPAPITAESIERLKALRDTLRPGRN